ncbi:MAG: hypothetical protein ACSHX8_02145 [Opitutaceae bacterium]
MRETSLTELLDGLSITSRMSVEQMLEDIPIEYLVMFEAEDGSKRKMVAVGPTLEHTDIDEVAVMEFKGMKASYYADAKVATTLQRLSDPDPEPEPEPEPESDTSEMQAQLDSAEEMVAELHVRLETAEAARVALEAEIESMRPSSGDEAKLKRQLEEVQDRLTFLDDREAELTQMEDEMVNRMNEYMEKIAHLEQREEDLLNGLRAKSSDTESEESLA